jgi:hypothetical protein
MGGAVRRFVVLIGLLCWSGAAFAGGGVLGNLRYAMGFGVHAGVGSTGLRDEAITPVLEGAAFEFRSYFSPQVASHTTLNLSRWVADATQGRARLDYDLHLGFSFPRADGVEPVIAPGASIGYTFDRSPDSRFTGDLRLGIDVGKPGGTFTWGVYSRPFVGWRVVGDEAAPEGKRGGLHAGVLIELVLLHHFKPRS